MAKIDWLKALGIASKMWSDQMDASEKRKRQKILDKQLEKKNELEQKRYDYEHVPVTKEIPFQSIVPGNNEPGTSAARTIMQALGTGGMTPSPFLFESAINKTMPVPDQVKQTTIKMTAPQSKINDFVSKQSLQDPDKTAKISGNWAKSIADADKTFAEGAKEERKMKQQDFANNLAMNQEERAAEDQEMQRKNFNNTARGFSSIIERTLFKDANDEKKAQKKSIAAIGRALAKDFVSADTPNIKKVNASLSALDKEIDGLMTERTLLLGKTDDVSKKRLADIEINIPILNQSRTRANDIKQSMIAEEAGKRESSVSTLDDESAFAIGNIITGKNEDEVLQGIETLHSLGGNNADAIRRAVKRNRALSEAQKAKIIAGSSF